MRITDIRETSIALNSTLKNCAIDFSEMTTSVVAVITEVMRRGKPVGGDPAIKKCFVYVGGGWYAPSKGIPELCDEMKRHLASGDTMAKMKVGGALHAEDIKRIEAVKRILPAHAELAVDANSKFDL